MFCGVREPFIPLEKYFIIIPALIIRPPYYIVPHNPPNVQADHDIF